MHQSMIKLIRLADVISIINASNGFIASLVLLIYALSQNMVHLRIAVSLIFFGLLADGLDGIIARKKGKGPLGEYIESIADMSSMIIAPSLVVFVNYQKAVSNHLSLNILLLFTVLLYMVCGMIRLAAFHPLKKQKTYLGLPASAAALIILLTSVFFVSFFYILPIIVIVSLLMILPVSFPKPSVKINIIATCLIFSTILLWDLFLKISPLIFLICMLLYVFIGPMVEHN